MKHKTITIIGGSFIHTSLLSDIKKASYIIACDRGAYWSLIHGIVPNEAVGDFDSVSKEEMQLINECVSLVNTYPKEKDFTDLELALERAIQLTPNEIVIYGATGGRFDHTMGASLLLERFSDSCLFIRCVDEKTEVALITDMLTIYKNKKYQYYSLFSLTKKSVVSLKGFYYTLDKGILKRGSTTGMSNELVEKKGQITVHEGTLLFIKSTNKKSI